MEDAQERATYGLLPIVRPTTRTHTFAQSPEAHFA